MITMTFYENGFEINGHAKNEICSQVSIFAWALSNVILNITNGDWYTSDYDNSNAGYSHFVYNTENERANEMFRLTKQMFYSWTDHFRWKEENHVQIVEKAEKLTGRV